MFNISHNGRLRILEGEFPPELCRIPDDKIAAASEKITSQLRRNFNIKDDCDATKKRKIKI